MKDYEVTDLLEVGDAGETIQEKRDPVTLDEIAGFMGPFAEAFEEE